MPADFVLVAVSATRLAWVFHKPVVNYTSVMSLVFPVRIVGGLPIQTVVIAAPERAECIACMNYMPCSKV